MHATLTVDLSALSANYQLLRTRHARNQCAAVVKANAYGLGIRAVSQRLWQEGCRAFFVATLEEAVVLRKILPEARLAVFGGLMPREEPTYIRQRIAPVLNDIGQLERWAQKAAPHFPAMLHVDTGMTRLGFTQGMLETACLRFSAHMKGLAMVLSHLACANDPEHPHNTGQLARFHDALRLLPGIPASFANSAGHFLPAAYHFDIGRPGCALYGINPANSANPMSSVVRLTAPLLQVRTLDRNESIGYGATAQRAKDCRIAIAGLGYADGWARMHSNLGHAFIDGIRVPVVGRVSMDMTALDVSNVPEVALSTKPLAEFINTEQTVDDIAAERDTIGYEVLTGLGARIKRAYIS